jgi:hypothetical protein
MRLPKIVLQLPVNAAADLDTRFFNRLAAKKRSVERNNPSDRAVAAWETAFTKAVSAAATELGGHVAEEGFEKMTVSFVPHPCKK